MAVLVVTRFRVPEADGSAFQAEAAAALSVLSSRPGFVEARVGRATDDPTLWAMASTWQNVGSYRRALSSYEVKIGAVPLLSKAIDEPSAYEIILGDGAYVPNEVKPRGDR